MSTDVIKFKKLLGSIGYTGRISERQISEAFKGREDVLQFLGMKLSKDNLVCPEKLQRLEELKKRHSSADTSSQDGYESENDMVEDHQGEFESTPNILEPRDNIRSLQDEAKREAEAWKFNQRKKAQLQGLERRLRRSIQKSSERFNAYNQRSKVLGSQVTAAQNDAWIACNLLDDARKSYLQVLESFRDVLVNDWEGWFFPLADLTEFWKCANSMEADMKQLQELLCSSSTGGGLSIPIDSHRDQTKFSRSGELISHRDSISRGDALRQETEYEKQPWFGEVKALHVCRQLLVREELKAARRLSSIQAKAELYNEFLSPSSSGEAFSTITQDLEDELHDLIIERKSLLQVFPKQCMQALESSQNVLLTGHLRTINGEWEALNKSKKSLLGFLNGHLTKYRAIEFLSQAQSSELEPHIEHIKFVKSQLQDLVSKTQLRRDQYASVGNNELATDFIPSGDALMNMINTAVALSDEAIVHMRDCFTPSDGNSGERDKNPKMLAAPLNILTPISKFQFKEACSLSRSLFAPQSPQHMLTSTSPWDDSVSNQSTPVIGTEDRSPRPSLSSLCTKLTALSDLYTNIATIGSEMLVDPKYDVKARVRMAEEIGRLYALMFPKKQSKEPTLSTSTIVDAFKSIKSLMHEIDIERNGIEEELMRFKVDLRADSARIEQRVMMSTFFSDQDAFVRKHTERVNEANRLRLGHKIRSFDA